MSKIKVAIIGTGKIFENHIREYLRHEEVEVYALCDINEKLVKEKAEKYNIPRTFTDLNEMLKLEEIDAVSVCVWNCNHAPCAIAALKAKKHVLCEKPMSMTVEEAVEMKKAADENGKLLMIGFVCRHGNDTKAVIDLKNSGFYGDLYYAKATYLRRNGNPGGWFGDLARSGGGPLIDLGVHVIDVVRYIAGNPKPVSVYGATFRKLGNRNELKDRKTYYSVDAKDDDVTDVEDLVSAMIRFDNGFVLDVESSYSLNTKHNVSKIELFGDKGGSKAENGLELYSVLDGHMVNIEYNREISAGDDFWYEISHFIDCIQGRTECIAPAEDGIEIMKILTAIYKSAETGHEVLL